MANTYYLIESVTITSAGGAASVSFNSIPQTYTDLVLMVSARSSYGGVGDDIYIDFNGTTTSRTGRFFYGNGSGTAGTTTPARRLGTNTADSSTANVFGSINAHIFNYTGSTNKIFISNSVSENNATTAYQDLHFGLWSSASPITSIQVSVGAGGGVLKQNSTFTLYGIKNS